MELHSNCCNKKHPCETNIEFLFPNRDLEKHPCETNIEFLFASRDLEDIERCYPFSKVFFFGGSLRLGGAIIKVAASVAGEVLL